MIVVDTNVIAYRFVEGEKTINAIRVERFDNDWRIPQLWRFEFLNVLSTLVKNKIINEDQGYVIWRNSIRAMGRKEEAIDYEKVLSFSIKNNISAYDAHYIFLAKSLKTKCITADKKLLKQFPNITLALLEF